MPEEIKESLYYIGDMEGFWEEWIGSEDCGQWCELRDETFIDHAKKLAQWVKDNVK